MNQDKVLEIEEKEEVKCERCGGMFPADEMTEHGGDMVCADCAAGYTTCTYCGAVCHEDDMTQTSEDGYVCDSCLDEYYRACDDCGELFMDDELTTTGDGRSVCNSCLSDYMRCASCGEFFTRDDMRGTATGDYICDNCYDEYYGTCEECGYVYRITDLDRNGYCHDCASNNIGLHDYHHGGEVIFHGKKEGPHYGMELEADKFEDQYNSAEELADPNSERDYCMEHDGSLDDGIEFIFQPRTMPSWDKYFPKLVALTQSIKDEGGRSFNTETCSVHIHRSRVDLTDMAITKLITAFIKLRSQLERAAQRRSKQWASFDFLENSVEGNCKLVYKTFKKGWYRSNRYVALNLTHPGTIEFRIFKGTLAPDTIRAYLMLVHYITEWAKREPILRMVQGTGTELWADFNEYLAEYGKETKILRDYLAKKGV